MTRLAASAPDLWKGLLRAGGMRETESLKALIAELEDLVALLSSGEIDEIEAYMDRTRRWREGGEVREGSEAKEEARKDEAERRKEGAS